MKVIVEVHGTEEQRDAFFEALLLKEIHKTLQHVTEKDFCFTVTVKDEPWDVYKFDTPKGVVQVAVRLDKAGKLQVGGPRLRLHTKEEWVGIIG